MQSQALISRVVSELQVLDGTEAADVCAVNVTPLQWNDLIIWVISANIINDCKQMISNRIFLMLVKDLELRCIKVKLLVDIIRNSPVKD